MPKPFISVHDLCMDYDDTRVLNNVSFEIPEGEIMGLSGGAVQAKMCSWTCSGASNYHLPAVLLSIT